MTAAKRPRGLKHMQPAGIGGPLPARKPKRLKSKSTIANPYVRALDGVAMVKATFSISVPVVERMQQFELLLKREGIGRNTWLEALIVHGIETNFMRETPEEAPSEPPPSEPPPPPAEEKAS